MEQMDIKDSYNRLNWIRIEALLLVWICCEIRESREKLLLTAHLPIYLLQFLTKSNERYTPPIEKTRKIQVFCTKRRVHYIYQLSEHLHIPTQTQIFCSFFTQSPIWNFSSSVTAVFPNKVQGRVSRIHLFKVIRSFSAIWYSTQICWYLWMELLKPSYHIACYQQVHCETSKDKSLRADIVNNLVTKTDKRLVVQS